VNVPPASAQVVEENGKRFVIVEAVPTFV
jgi:hypothetical protein